MFPLVAFRGLDIPEANRKIEELRSDPKQNFSQKIFFTTDKFSRRISLGNEKLDHHFFLAFWGCSFTFGSNVDDHDTLPSQAAALLPTAAAYNYGLHGGGLNESLMRIRMLPPAKEINEKSGIGIYVFIGDHLRRLSASMSYIGSWSWDPPYFEEIGGKLVSMGTYSKVHPFLYRMKKFLAKSNVVRFFSIDFPNTRSEKNFALAALYLKSMRDAFEENFPNQKFLVLFFPGDGSYSASITPYLDKDKIPYLDYSGLPIKLIIPEPPYFADGHPTPEVYRSLAGLMVHDLSAAGLISRTEIGKAAGK
ncbi:MAG: hypothetical protein ACXWQO_20230 [Bdellovibrionota bacterium]